MRGERERRGEGEMGRMGDPALEAVANPSRGIMREMAMRRKGYWVPTKIFKLSPQRGDPANAGYRSRIKKGATANVC
jgi:hypothetical protein